MTAPYRDILARLVTARRFGVVLGLDRMRTLLDALGRPDERLGRVIHVAGTNGKGSTVAMLASMLRAAGVRVGVYTSPHLHRLTQRIEIDGAELHVEELARIAEVVSAAGGDELTFFEQVTAIALVAFAEAALDVTILEVGLGGRLDATNVVRSDVAVVTGVAMDHEAVLGGSLEAIAGEKAGIFKPGAAFVIGAAGEPAAVPVLVAAARGAGSEPVVVREPATLPVALPGAHQRVNAATALAALDAVARRGGPVVDEAARAQGLATVVHPGRFEVIDDGAVSSGHAEIRFGRVILDGAHNPQGAAALADALRERGERPVLVLGVSEDKDVRAILRALLPAVGAVLVTRADHDRAMDPRELARIVREVSDEQGAERIVEVGSESLLDTLRTAGSVRLGPKPILVAGSLFLVGEARAILRREDADPVRATDPAARPR